MSRQGFWNIGIIYEPINNLLSSRPEVHWLPEPAPDRFLADPFAIKVGNSLFILCEEFNYHTGKGRIVSIELTDEGVSAPRVAIEPQHHISYPYLIENNGKIYCVPETRSAQEIALYEAEVFPDRWSKVTTLVNNFAGLDATVFQYRGRWWLASTDSQFRLFIWHATDLLGPWISHASNPVKQDASSARSAGTPFTSNGSLYRPAQDCSKSYGKRVVLNRIISLSPLRFEELRAAIVEPYRDGPYPNGVHTLSSAGEYTLIDGRRTVFTVDSLRRSLKGRLSRSAFSRSSPGAVL